MLERLGPDTELHVIDPVPEFDPAEHEKQFPGRYIFHRDVSHNVLPTLPAVDVALVDGDHNWFTVYHELRMLSESARKAGAPLPVLIMHDVLWPYGRRDLYYVPERVPEEFRQPYEKKGIRPGDQEGPAAGWPQPAALQRGRRGRRAQRCDDRARRLHRRVRPAAARARAADLLRARDRRGGSATRAGARARAAARSLRVGRGQGRPAADRGVDAAPGDPVPAQRLLRPARRGDPGRQPLPRSARRRHSSTSSTSTTSSGSSTSRAASSSARHPSGPSSAIPCARCS